MSTSGGTDSIWRAALGTLRAALAGVRNRAELNEAKAELTTLLDDVSLRAHARGPNGDPLQEAMLAASSRAVAGQCDAAMISKLIAGMTATLQVEVDAADPANGTVDASAAGEWSLHGRTYTLTASVTERHGRVEKGSIRVGGFNFVAQGDLADGGSLDCEREAAAWAQAAGVQVSPANASRVVAASLEVLVKRRAQGIADVDVVKIVFGLLKRACGCVTPKRIVRKRALAAGDAAAARLSSSAPVLTPAAMAAEEAAAEQCAAEALEQELRRHRGAAAMGKLRSSVVSGGAVSSRALRTGAQASALPLPVLPVEGPSSSVQADSAEQATPQDLLQEFVSAVASSAAARPGPEQDASLRTDPAPSEVVPVSGTCSDDDDVEKASPARSCNEDAFPDDEDVEAEVAAEVEADEDGTAFIGRTSFETLKARVARGEAPTETELVEMLNVEALPEDEELIPMDLTMLGDSVASASRSQAIVALVQTNGARKVAELLIAAAADGDVCDEDDEDEDGEEEEKEGDEEEEQNADDADMLPGSSTTEPAAKRTKR